MFQIQKFMHKRRGEKEEDEEEDEEEEEEGRIKMKNKNESKREKRKSRNACFDFQRKDYRFWLELLVSLALIARQKLN